MLHPSYSELMNTINERAEGDEPIVSSRYSVVIAAAKRARQLIAETDPSVEDYEIRKPLSIAVEELMTGAVNIISSGDRDSEDEPVILSSPETYSISLDDEYYEEDEEFSDSEDEEESEDEDDDKDDYE